MAIDHALSGSKRLKAWWAKIRAAVPDAKFYIVGRHPAPEVKRLAERDGIVVTGGVPDVRPYLAHARAAMLPLRIARGILVKGAAIGSLLDEVVATLAIFVGALALAVATFRKRLG